MAVETITTVTAPATATPPAGPYDLTDLATVKDELTITDTSADNFLSRAITQASAAIARYCNRVFQVEGLTDLLYIQQDPYPYQVPGGVFPLQLSRWPIVGTIASVLQTIAENTTQTLNLGTDFAIDAKRGWLIRLDPFTGVATKWEAMPVSVAYSAGYTKTAYEAGTVGNVPYTVQVTNAAKFAADGGVVYASNGAALVAVAAAPAAGQYSVAAGVYTFNAADAGKSVLISYDYAAIPDDVVDACLRLVTARYRARGRDPMLRQQTTQGIGEQVFWVGGPPMSGSVPEEIAGILQNYRVPVIA